MQAHPLHMQGANASAVHAAFSPLHAIAMPQAGPSNDVIMEGWALKKRRKKMQGFARRYFTLYHSGVLSYAFEPNQPARDHILLPQAAISTAPGRKDIHIDSASATFHLKCLSEDDFIKWMSAFRKYMAPDTPTIGRKSSISRSVPRLGHFNRTGLLVEEMNVSIRELQAAYTALAEADAVRKAGNAKSKHDKEKGKEHHKEHHTVHVRALFKPRRSGHNVHAGSQDGASEDGSIAESTHDSQSLDAHLQRLQTAIESLKYQHSALSQTLATFSLAEQGPSLRGSPLLATAREEAEVPTPSTGFSTIGRASGRLSTISDGSIWYDAEEYDGAEEFVLDVPPDDSQGSKLSEAESTTEPPSTATSSANTDVSSESSDAESFAEATPDNETPPSSSNACSADEVVIVRRTQLPSPPVSDEGSLFTVLKKNVGKDLSQVALPVTFNEPLTLLQRLAEELEYYDLLAEAVKSTDDAERICYVAAFAVSAYASTKYRSGRKAFNPMLAETFEDARLRLVAEKVCHNPVVLAYHAEGDGWELYATSSGKTKFWGKSLEIIPQGMTHLVIGQDHYEWTRPSSFMRGLMMGTKYLEHTGKMVIENKTTGSRCSIDFKERGYWGIPNQVAGSVISSDGTTIATLEGKWDEQIALKLDDSHLKVLWRLTPFPRNAPEYYGFTSFGITLNEITPDIAGKLPPTDSRLRTDVRALEEGNLDLAEEEKVRTEELQRERRRQGQERKPRWFKKVGEEWEYVGGYWEQRAQGFKDVEPLW